MNLHMIQCPKAPFPKPLTGPFKTLIITRAAGSCSFTLQ